MPRSVASEIESRFSRINASLLESTVTMTRGRFLFAAVGLAVFFCVRTLFLLPCMGGLSYCPHIEARTTSTNDTMTYEQIRRRQANGRNKRVRAIEITAGQSSMFCADLIVANAWISWHRERGIESDMMGAVIVDPEEVTSNKP